MAFSIFSHDVTQAYLQSEDNLTCEVYLSPKPKDQSYFKIDEDEVLQLTRPLYRTFDAGDYWNKTIHNHCQQDLKVVATKGDPSLYFKVDENGTLQGLMGV